jgi:hypothetical protein
LGARLLGIDQNREVMFQFAYTLIKALAAIPSIINSVKEFAAGCAYWYAEIQTRETLSEIADAAALSARAETSEDRYAALSKWRAALSNARRL